MLDGYRKVAVGIGVLVLGCAGAVWAEPIVHRGENVDPAPAAVAGAMPYEMAGRGEPGRSIVDFADVTGWEVEGHDAEGWLYRTKDQRLWSEYSAKLVYMGKGDKPVLNVRLREPVKIPDDADLVQWWNFGNRWGWVADPKIPFIGAAILLRDAEGKDFAIWPGTIDHAYWFMMCARISAQQKKDFKRPYSFVGYQFHGATNKEKCAIYLGPCYFVREELKPLSLAAWPPEKLPFPTRPETILPTNKTADFKNAVRREGEQSIFSYEGSDAKLEYAYTPRTGTFDDLELRHGGKSLRPCAGGGIQLAGAKGVIAPTAAEVSRKLESCELVGDVVRAKWKLQGGERATTVTYEMRISQKSLILDITTSEPTVDRVALGRAEPVREPKLIKIPYLTFGWNNTDPSVLYNDGLFVFTQFDWYVSDASKLLGAKETGEGWAVFNGGALYTPKTDGTRNCVRERLFINASPDVQEVLPHIPNPPSPFKEVQGERLWRMKMGDNYAGELAEARKLRELGCDKLTIRYHEDTFRDGGESFTFRLKAAPGRGGDAALRQFVSDIKSLGWRCGLYTNYTDFAAVNALWDPDHVIRLPNGDWQRAWMRCYAPKPMWGWQMEAEYAPVIHEKFGTNHSYCDVHTVFMPCEREDYDARVPGAATFRRTYECYGRLLYNEKFAHEGPVFSEGRNHWIYAGLTDGNYAQLASPAPSKEPFLVDFDLLKIHPLEMDAGMGAPGMFFGQEPADLDQFIATTLAYGHIGFCEWHQLDGLLKVYNMIQPAQSLYAMVPVKSIEYEADGKMLDTSRALITGAYLKSRVHVVYENGTEVYVNGSDQPWALALPLRETSGGDFVFAPSRASLPKWGYVVTHQGRIVCASAEFPGVADGRRIDVSFGRDLRYVDSRGGPAGVAGLTVEGSAIVKRDGDCWYVIPATKLARIVLSPGVFGWEKNAGIEVVALGPGGQPEIPVTLNRVEAGLELVPGDKPSARYKVRPASR